MRSLISSVDTTTFDALSIIAYGHAESANLLSRANSGVSEPIPPGTRIITPQLSMQTIPPISTDPLAVTLVIDGRIFSEWTEVSVNMSVTGMHQASFSSANNQAESSLSPTAFHRVDVFLGGSLLFSGTMVDVNPNLYSVVLSCYSLPGVLGDCTSPPGGEVQFTGQNLLEISRFLAAPFGIGVSSVGDLGEPFGGSSILEDPVRLGFDSKILPFIIGLAKQRGVLVSSTNTGNLLLHTPVSGIPPVARLIEGEHPLISTNTSFMQQGFFSSITGVSPSSVLFPDGHSVTIQNPFLMDGFRPTAFKSADASTEAELQLSTKAAMRRMIGSSLKVRVKLSQWTDANGNPWEPGSFVTLQAPGSLIANESEFLIESVTLSQNESMQEAALDLVLPGLYDDGDLPSSLPF